MENIYSNYNSIAEGFSTFLKSADKQKAGFNAMKRSYLSGMDYVKNIFDEGGNMPGIFWQVIELNPNLYKLSVLCFTRRDN